MKTRLLCLFALVLVLFSACQKEPAREANPYLGFLGNSSAAFSQNDPANVTIKFRTNVPWTVEMPSDAWFQVSPLSGDPGSSAKSFDLIVSTSSAKVSRSSSFIIRYGNLSKSVKVSQSALHLCSEFEIPNDMIFSTTLGRNNTNVAQGFDYDPDDDIVFITQKYGTYRNHIGWQKREVNSSTTVAANYMTLSCFSHGNNISIEKKDGVRYVWAPNYSNRESDGSYDQPKIVSRFPLKSGQTLIPTDPVENYYFGKNCTWPAFDFKNDMMAICADYKNFYVYRLSELMALPTTDVTLDFTITYGGSSPVDSKLPEYSGKPTVKAKDCRSVKPLYTVPFNYGSRGLHWQTYCIDNGWIYAILQADKKSAPDIIFDTYVEAYKMDGSKNLYKIRQEYMQNRDRIVELGWTEKNNFYCEPEGIKVMGDTMLLMYTIKGGDNFPIRRPVIFKLANPVLE